MLIHFLFKVEYLEYLEMLNRDRKNITSGHQTKESIIAHSKHFPHLIMWNIMITFQKKRGRKGFDRLPVYKIDVEKAAKELFWLSTQQKI